jgi:two-component system, cell cycle sensor histidine kinase and response regulator CckA
LHEVENVRQALAELRDRLAEAEQSLRAISSAEVTGDSEPPGPRPAAPPSSSDARLLATIFDVTREALLVVQDDGVCVGANPAACALLECAHPDLLGAPLDALAPRLPELGAAAGVLRGRGRTSGAFPVEPSPGGRRIESSNLLPVGPNRNLLVLRPSSGERSSPMPSSEIRSEEQLRQAQKLEALGSLAGGVAHDFNNLLSIILTQVSLILDGLPANDPLFEDVTLIRRAGERGAELTRQLLAFSRQQILQPRVLDLNETIVGMDQMLRRLIREDIGLSLNTASGLGKVKADLGQLEQVILNLVVNARDAMPQGGTLRIETRNAELRAGSPVCNSGAPPGPYTVLSVTDSGVGMAPEVRARIFEPFFTTKAKGKGTGLGLSTVFGIVQQSGGHLRVESEPGRGSTFEIYLPQVSRDSALEIAAPSSPTTLQGSETILLVEDDDEVRTTASRILRRLGYRVLEAQNGGEALLLMEQHPEAVDLVVTDLVMPLMSGRQLAARLGATYPELRFLFMSGYTDDETARDPAHAGQAIPFVNKPLTPSTFARKIREVLDG